MIVTQDNTHMWVWVYITHCIVCWNFFTDWFRIALCPCPWWRSLLAAAAMLCDQWALITVVYSTWLGSGVRFFFCVADDAWPNRIKSPMKFDVIPWCEKLVDSCYIKFLRRFDLPKVYLFFAPQNTKITKQPSWAQALPKTTFVHIYSKIHYTHADLAMTVQ